MIRRARALALARFARWLPALLASGPRSRRSAADLVERAAARYPARDFVRFEGRAWSYGELNAAANRIAHFALASGVRRGDVVGLLSDSRPELLAAWIGLAKCGATTALLNPQLRGRALAHCLESAGVRRLVLGEECLPALASLGRDATAALELHVLADPARAERAPLPPAATSLDDEAAGYSPLDPPRRVRAGLRAGDPLFLIFTSGTTGLPKAARMSHSRFLGAGLYALLAGLSARDALYCPLPLHHTAGGVMAVGAVLRVGATLALRRRFSATQFWDDVVEMRATAFQYIGELCRYLASQPPHPRERAHRLRFCIGNGLRPDVWETFQRRFAIPHVVEFYGATESNVSLVNLEDRVGSVGRPLPGVRAALVRCDPETGEPLRDSRGRCTRCADGEPGELVGRVAGGRTAAGRFEGYTSAEASERKLLRDVFRRGDLWFKSGDLLRRERDGSWWFVDRLGDTFRWKGENVSTQEIAEALQGFPAVELAAVYGVEVPGAEGRAGMAALALRDGAELDGRALYAHAAAALPGFARPAFVRVWRAPELTATLKVRKGELQRDGFDPARVRDPLFWRDDAAGAYRPLDTDAFARIGAGALRF
jgi:fatty-acyl-CoA synthase